MNRFEKRSFLMSTLSQRFVCLPYLFKMNTNYITYLHNALTFLEYFSICYQCEHLYLLHMSKLRPQKSSQQHVAKLVMKPRTSVLKSCVIFITSQLPLIKYKYSPKGIAYITIVIPLQRHTHRTLVLKRNFTSLVQISLNSQIAYTLTATSSSTFVLSLFCSQST